MEHHPGPHTLLGFHVTTDADGITTLTVHAHDPEGARIYGLALRAQPHVADAFRLEIGREIPHRPLEPLTLEDIRARHDAFAALVATAQP